MEELKPNPTDTWTPEQKHAWHHLVLNARNENINAQLRALEAKINTLEALLARLGDEPKF